MSADIVQIPGANPIMTEEQRQWYWAGRIDAVAQHLGITPCFAFAAGTPPRKKAVPAVVVPFPGNDPPRRKPKP
jgi:hypothetical protein